jgi:hypothetical protein
MKENLQTGLPSQLEALDCDGGVILHPLWVLATFW